MNNFWNKTNTILSILAILVAIFIGWYFNRDKETSLNIEEINATLLTQNLHMEGLSVKYFYNDSIEVKKLWKTLFAIKNTGEQSLYGKGFSEMNVQNGLIPLKLNGGEKLLSIRVRNSNNGTTLNKNYELVVTQWKPNEYIEIEVLSEGEVSPKLQISERGIKDASITYSEYTPSLITSDPKIIDSLPYSLRNVIKWMIFVVMGILIIAAITQIPSQLKDTSMGVRITTIILWIFFMAVTISPILWII